MTDDLVFLPSDDFVLRTCTSLAYVVYYTGESVNGLAWLGKGFVVLGQIFTFQPTDTDRPIPEVDGLVVRDTCVPIIWTTLSVLICLVVSVCFCCVCGFVFSLYDAIQDQIFESTLMNILTFYSEKVTDLRLAEERGLDPNQVRTILDEKMTITRLSPMVYLRLVDSLMKSFGEYGEDPLIFEQIGTALNNGTIEREYDILRMSITGHLGNRYGTMPDGSTVVFRIMSQETAFDILYTYLTTFRMKDEGFLLTFTRYEVTPQIWGQVYERLEREELLYLLYEGQIAGPLGSDKSLYQQEIDFQTRGQLDPNTVIIGSAVVEGLLSYVSRLSNAVPFLGAVFVEGVDEKDKVQEVKKRWTTDTHIRSRKPRKPKKFREIKKPVFQKGNVSKSLDMKIF